jgi:hypothetical protein
MRTEQVETAGVVRRLLRELAQTVLHNPRRRRRLVQTRTTQEQASRKATISACSPVCLTDASGRLITL